MTDPALNVHRARLYKLASLAFDRPGDQLRAALESGEFDDQLQESAQAVADTYGDEELERLATAVVERSPTEPTEIDELADAYARLFGLEHGGAVSQYQITYSPGTVLTSTSTIADLSGFYKAFGLGKVDGHRDRSDHLCLQLEFLSHVALQTSYLDLDGDDRGREVVTNAQREFIADHLGRWIPRFREAVEEETDDSFHTALTQFLEAFVDLEADHFDVAPSVFPETPASPTAHFTGDDQDGDFRCTGCGIDNMPGQNPTMPSGSKQTPDH